MMLRRHGFRRAIAVVSPALLAYAVWYAAVGRLGPRTGAPEELRQLYVDVPIFVLHMVVSGFAEVSPVWVVGIVLSVALLSWGLLTARQAGGRELIVYVYALIVPVFAIAAGISRIGLGVQTALESRYLYLVVGLLMPLAALAIHKLAQRVSWRGAYAVAAGLFVGLAIIGVVQLQRGLAGRAEVTSAIRQGASAIVVWVEAHPHEPYPADAMPFETLAPQDTVADVLAWREQGWFTPLEVPPDVVEAMWSSLR
jgi:hypothetical protein